MQESPKSCKPAPGKCGCGAAIDPDFMPPVVFNGRRITGTGEWQIAESCPACVKAKETAARAEERRAAYEAAVRQSGMRPVELSMSLKTWRATDAMRSACADWAAGKKPLFIYGPAGTGKTHFAVACLKSYVWRTGAPGLFRNTPLMLADLRKLVRSSGDADERQRIINAPALVLDDIGVERATDYALEAMYLIVDGWNAKNGKPIVFTSNLEPDELRTRLDDRIVSRIVGMSRVINLSGEDQRIAGRLT